MVMDAAMIRDEAMIRDVAVTREEARIRDIARIKFRRSSFWAFSFIQDILLCIFKLL